MATDPKKVITWMGVLAFIIIFWALFILMLHNITGRKEQKTSQLPHSYFIFEGDTIMINRAGQVIKIDSNGKK